MQGQPSGTFLLLQTLLTLHACSSWRCLLPVAFAPSDTNNTTITIITMTAPPFMAACKCIDECSGVKETGMDRTTYLVGLQVHSDKACESSLLRPRQGHCKKRLHKKPVSTGSVIFIQCKLPSR